MSGNTAQASASLPRGAEAYGARILVVEPRPVTTPMLRRWLERRGHALDVATDEGSAFQRAVITAPDVVLIDLGSGRSGFALAHRLRRDPSTATLPLVAVGDETPAQLGGAERLFARYVLKPIDVDELGAVLVDAATR